MKIETSSNSSARVELSKDEILILNNALNEILNGLDLTEFETRVGFDREDVERLLDELRVLVIPARH